MKYQQRLELERASAFQDAMGPLRKVHDDREDRKRMHGATWGEIVRRSRGLDD